MADKKFIYADNAATSPLSPRALEAMLPYLSDQFANASQPYSFARRSKKALLKSREIVASCIGASPSEIYFTSGGSESNNWVFRDAIDCKRDIITSSIEHHSVMRCAEHAAKLGHSVVFLPVTSTGLVELANLKEANVSQGALASVMLASNEIGSVQKISELAHFVHNRRGLFHTDAVQAVGHIDIDVKSLGVDMLSASAHKFNGPKGIGFLYLKEGVILSPLIYGGSQEFGLRAGTENVASIVGMAVALEENVCNIEENAIHISEVEQVFLSKLSELGVSCHRNGATEHIPGNISLSFPNSEGEMLLHRLDLMGIMVSTGSACDSKQTQISHVLHAIGLDHNLAKGTIRISFGKHNTTQDALTLAQAIAKIIAK